MTWLAKAWAVLRALLGLSSGSASDRELAVVQRELDRERGITAALRLRIVDKEARIRELEAKLAEHDPGALLDSVFGGKPAN